MKSPRERLKPTPSRLKVSMLSSVHHHSIMGSLFTPEKQIRERLESGGEGGGAEGVALDDSIGPPLPPNYKVCTHNTHDWYHGSVYTPEGVVH